jgi:hypothetical protein
MARSVLSSALPSAARRLATSASPRVASQPGTQPGRWRWLSTKSRAGSICGSGRRHKARRLRHQRRPRPQRGHHDQRHDAQQGEPGSSVAAAGQAHQQRLEHRHRQYGCHHRPQDRPWKRRHQPHKGQRNRRNQRQRNQREGFTR